jgi:hypothetical protein
MKDRRFNEVARPKTGKMAAAIEEGSTPYLAMPGRGLLPREQKFWDKAEETAKAGNDILAREVAWRLSTEMGIASNSELQIYGLLATGRRPDPADLIEWYNRTTNYLAYSRMWRQIGTDLLKPEQVRLLQDWEPTSEEQNSIIVEQTNDEPRCGIQVVPGLFRRLFEVEPPQNETIWLEGQDIFVQAITPAESGVLLTARYEEGGETFPASEFVTARPFLKAEVWQPRTGV